MTIFHYCSTTMQQHIRESNDFALSILNNPIVLLAAIKELTHSPIRAKYLYATLTNVFQHLINNKQQENKGLLNYTAQFKQERDILKIYIGKKILDKFVEKTEEYRNTNSTVQQNLKDESFNH